MFEFDHSFFQNTNCEYFPCHKIDKVEDFNCLFCYCPLYSLGKNCGGNFYYSGDSIKVCTNCLKPHLRSNYKKIIKKTKEVIKLVAQDFSEE